MIEQDKIRKLQNENRVKLGISLVLVTGVLASALFVVIDADRAEDDEFNRADLMFMNMMIVHHNQAIKMAELSENRTDNENILNLSRNISEAQKAENRQMSEWMRNLGYEPGNHHLMAGMASGNEMQELRNSNGSEFNENFAKLMIKHHQGGIEMAQNFYEAGRNSELGKMQQNMIQTQQTEIEKMNKWLEEDQL